MPNNFQYTTGIPNPPVLPSQDVANMQTNTTSINSLIAVDHIPFNNAGSGIHSRVQFPTPINTTTALGDGSTMLYSRLTTNNGTNWYSIFVKDNNPAGPFDLPLFGRTSGSPNGIITLYGGIIVQWGTSAVNLIGSLTPINFTLPFPNNVWNIQLSMIQNSVAASPNANSVQIVGSMTTTSQFTVSNSSSSTITQIYWTAIGN